MSGYGQTSFFLSSSHADLFCFEQTLAQQKLPWGNSAPYGESTLPYLLSRIGLTISVPVLPISDAKHCICQRKALHLPTQSFASANAKLCNRPRKALQSSTQSIALTLPQTFAWKRCLHFEIPFPCFPDTWFSLVCFAFPFSWRPVLQMNGRIYAQHILSLKSSNITYVLSHVKESARKTFFQKKTHNSYRYRVFLLTLS